MVIRRSAMLPVAMYIYGYLLLLVRGAQGVLPVPAGSVASARVSIPDLLKRRKTVPDVAPNNALAPAMGLRGAGSTRKLSSSISGILDIQDYWADWINLEQTLMIPLARQQLYAGFWAALQPAFVAAVNSGGAAVPNSDVMIQVFNFTKGDEVLKDETPTSQTLWSLRVSYDVAFTNANEDEVRSRVDVNGDKTQDFLRDLQSSLSQNWDTDGYLLGASKSVSLCPSDSEDSDSVVDCATYMVMDAKDTSVSFTGAFHVTHFVPATLRAEMEENIATVQRNTGSVPEEAVLRSEISRLLVQNLERSLIQLLTSDSTVVLYHDILIKDLEFIPDAEMLIESSNFTISGNYTINLDNEDDEDEVRNYMEGDHREEFLIQLLNDMPESEFHLPRASISLCPTGDETECLTEVRTNVTGTLNLHEYIPDWVELEQFIAVSGETVYFALVVAVLQPVFAAAVNSGGADVPNSDIGLSISGYTQGDEVLKDESLTSQRLYSFELEYTVLLTSENQDEVRAMVEFGGDKNEEFLQELINFYPATEEIFGFLKSVSLCGSDPDLNCVSVMAMAAEETTATVTGVIDVTYTGPANVFAVPEAILAAGEFQLDENELQRLISLIVVINLERSFSQLLTSGTTVVLPRDILISNFDFDSEVRRLTESNSFTLKANFAINLHDGDNESEVRAMVEPGGEKNDEFLTALLNVGVSVPDAAAYEEFRSELAHENTVVPDNDTSTRAEGSDNNTGGTDANAAPEPNAHIASISLCSSEANGECVTRVAPQLTSSGRSKGGGSLTVAALFSALLTALLGSVLSLGTLI